MTKRIATILAAAALLSSGTARAQAHRQPGSAPPPKEQPSSEQPRPNIPWVGGDRNAPRPAPAPKEQPGAQATQPGQQGQLSDDQRRMLGLIRYRNGILMESGRLAKERGQSNELRQYGERLDRDHQRLDKEIEQLATERGVAFNSLPQPGEELKAHHARLEHMRALPPEQFDREMATMLKDLGRQYEADLKKMRDETPGSDARLKSWLDQTENVAEEDRLTAQQLLDRMDEQRQARRPQTGPGR